VDNLLKNGVYVVSEGANMPTTMEGVHRFLQAGILYGPGKAANAGGVATSGLEMAQNSMRISWTREEVDARLFKIMKSIHAVCHRTAEKYGTPGNYVNGANISSFLKVADAMMDEENKLTQMTASREVVLTQPQRRGTGDRIEYAAVDETAVLTGNLAEVEDRERGVTTKGARLTLHLRDARIEANSESGAKRVRTTHRIQR